jgi:pyridine nucleotide-disulfide oxidoreductase family protein
VTRLVLLGAGHAHLFVLEAVAQGAFADAEVTLVSPLERQVYSGMIPGMLAGRYRPEELSFDLEAIARRAGVRYVSAAGRRIRADGAEIELDGGAALPYDILSIATGSTVRGTDLPGIGSRALSIKPIDRALAIVPALAEALRADKHPPVVVAGGGAGGIELALAVRARLSLLAGAGTGIVTLLESAPRLFGGRLPSLEHVVERALARNQVALRCSAEVVAATESGVRLEDGSEVRARVLIWAAGAAAPDLLRTSGLALDAQGFIVVDERLRSVSHPRIFAAGDAATPARWPDTPKAGVYAVREGPVLCANLAAASRGLDLPRVYRPQRRALALLNTGDGRAILSYGRLAASGKWVMALKDGIDRKFVRRFQRLGDGSEVRGKR